MRRFSYILLFLFGESCVFVALLLTPPRIGWSLISIGVLLAAVFLYHLFFQTVKKKVDRIKIAGLTWTANDFCRGVLVTGQTGSGKTASAIRQILFALFRGAPDFGALVVDEKGQFYEAVEGVARFFRRQDKLVVLRVSGKTKTPAITYNPLSYPGISWKNWSSLILDTAQSIGVKLESFWWENARDLFESILTITASKKQPTLADLYDTISSPQKLQMLSISPPTEKDPDPLVERARNRIRTFLKDPPAQRDGVLGSCRTIVNTFSTPQIQKVFCSGSSFDFRDIDAGKIVCLSLSAEFGHERRFFNTFFKLLFYTHAKYRFNDPAELKKKNLIVFLADEALQIVTSSDANSDYDAVAVMREARATCVFATQAITSLSTKLKQEEVKALILNMATQFCFTAGDQDTAEILSRSLGVSEKEITDRRRDEKGESVSYRTEEKPVYSPADLRALRKFECIVKHPSGETQKLFLDPIDDDGKTPVYYYRERFGALLAPLYYWMQL